MSLSKKLVYTSILAGVSALALTTFTHEALADRTVTAGGTASFTPSGGVAGTLTQSGSGYIVVNNGVALTNDGTTGTGAPNGEIVLLDDTTPAANGIRLENNASLTLSGGTNSTIFVKENTASTNGIVLNGGSSVNKTGGASGNAIFSENFVSILNNGTIAASNGSGTIFVNNNAGLTYSGTGNVSNTGGNDADDDAIRVVGTGAVSLTIGGNITSAAGGSAIDLAGATATGQTVTFHDAGGSLSGIILLGGGAGTSNINFTGNGDSLIAGAITGTAGAITTMTVNKTTGMAHLSGAVTEVDNLVVTAGKLDLDAAGSSFGKASVASGATLDLASINGAFTVGDAGTAGDVTDDFVLNGTLTSSATAILNANLTLNAGSVVNGALSFGTGTNTITYNGGTINNVLSMADAGTHTFNVVGADFTTNATMNGVDALNISANRTFTANHNVNNLINGTGDFTLGAGSKLVANTGDVRTAGNIVMGNNSTVQVGAGRFVTANSVTGANGTFAFDFNNTNAGKLILSTLANMSNYTLNPLAAADFSLTGSKSYVIVDGLAGNATKFGTLIDTNTLFTYTQTEDDVNGDIILHIARQNQMDQIATNPNNKSAAPAVEQLLTRNTNIPQGSRDPATVALAARLTTSTDAQINGILQTLIPTVDQGGVQAAMNVNNQVNNQINGRLGNTRNDTGAASGDLTEGLRFWMQGFGSSAQQDRRQGIAGYDADTFGGTVGADAEVTDNTLAGIAVSYANTQVDSKNANTTDTEVDSYQVTAYGSYIVGQGSYLNGYLSYSYNDIDQQRHNVGIIGNTARAGYHNDQYDARVELGHDYNNVLNTTGLTLTPEFSVQYTAVDAGRYSEKGAGGLALQNVESDTLEALDLGLDVTLAYSHRTENGSVITPSINAGYTYEALGETLETSGRFLGGAMTFTTKGYEPAQHSVNGGLGLNVQTTTGWDFNAMYDYTNKSDFDAHTGVVKAVYAF